MRYADRPSWLMFVDEPWVLVMALYLRDVAGLTPVHDGPVLPPLDPFVPAEPAGVDVAAASAQWSAWWSDALRVGDVAELVPPGFPAFDHAPELQALLRRHFAAANGWAAQRKREHVPLAVGPEAADLGGLVRAVEVELGRTAAPFELRITELPVAGKELWVLAADDVVVSRALFADAAEFLHRLAPVVRALA